MSATKRRKLTAQERWQLRNKLDVAATERLGRIPEAERHPADRFGLGRAIVFIEMRATQPVEYLKARARHGDWQAQYDLSAQNGLRWEVDFHDRCAENRTPSPYCTSCSHLNYEHSWSCTWGEGGQRYIEWVRARLARHCNPRDWHHGGLL